LSNFFLVCFISLGTGAMGGLDRRMGGIGQTGFPLSIG
jgi:hypothetical protein